MPELLGPSGIWRFAFYLNFKNMIFQVFFPRRYYNNFTFWKNTSVCKGRGALLFCLLLLLSCEEATDWDLKTGENGQLVVEAIMTNEAKRQEVLLSLSYDDLNGQPIAVTDAIIWLTNGQGTFPFPADPDQPGRYLSILPGAVQTNTNYQLHMEWNGEVYSAESKMGQVFPFAALDFLPAGQGDGLKLRKEPFPLYSIHQQAMYIIDIDWSHLSSEEPNRARQIHYTFKTIDVNELFRPEQEEVIFPKGSKVIVKKYGLNDDFAKYLRALVMETEWQGGVFDEASASLPTNVSNGGLGFFSVCPVLSDTLVAE